MTPTAYQPIVLDLAQGSSDWLAWRQNGLGSSDASAVMGVSPWVTPLRLWELKTGRIEPAPPTAAMRRGTELEAQARREFEFEHDDDFRPVCLVHPEYPFLKASLDGWSRDGTTVLEVKAPGAKAHAEALAGRIPAYYVPQVQHLLLVSGARQCCYWSWTPETGGVLLTAERDAAYLEVLLATELEFWRMVQTDEPPAATEHDPHERRDEPWRRAALNYQRAKTALAEAEHWEAEAKAELLDLADGRACAGYGVSVSPREGSIAWKQAATDLADILGEPIDLEKYRGRSTMQVRLAKEKA